MSREYAQCEQLCRPLFRKEPRDVPAELVSGDYSLLLGMTLLRLHLLAAMPQFGGLMNNLIVTTDRLIMGSHTAATPSTRPNLQGKMPRIAPTPLAWSVALRASRDITIQASIEYVVCLMSLISFI
jgi:hypothetical protein